MNEVLRLPATGLEQDWEVELSDGIRISEFLDAYENGNYDDEVKRALMALIISSFDSALNSDAFDADKWRRATILIQRDLYILKPVLHYWLPNADEDGFAVSDLIAQVGC